MVMHVMLRKEQRTEAPESSVEPETCQRCGNAYILLWLGRGEHYTDLGDRHCPFCGLCIDECTGSVVEWEAGFLLGR